MCLKMSLIKVYCCVQCSPSHYIVSLEQCSSSHKTGGIVPLRTKNHLHVLKFQGGVYMDHFVFPRYE